MSKEIGRFGVRCNAIRPFAIGTSTGDFAETATPWLKLIGVTMGPTPGVEQPVSFNSADFPPAKIAPFVVWLCTDAASNVNGRTFEVRGDYVSLLSEPVGELTIHQAGGWSLDSLDTAAPAALTRGFSNPHTL